MKEEIIFPYQSDDYEIRYVPLGNRFIRAAMEYAREFSLDDTMPTGSVVVYGENIIGKGANGSNFHKKKPCERVLRKIPTGQGYELCEGCHPKNHSERRALHDASMRGQSTNEADIYLFGHWWCCKPCWDAMRNAQIKNVFLLEGSHIVFNKDHPDNIVGRQFKLL